MWRWNFDMDCVDMILGHNVEYTGSVSRLPIWGLEWSNGSHLERGGMPIRTEIWHFQGMKVDKKDWNFYGRILIPRPTISRGIHCPGPLAPARKNPMSGLTRFSEATIRGWQGRVNKAHRWQSGHHDLNTDLACIASYFWAQSGLQNLPLLSVNWTAEFGLQDSSLKTIWTVTFCWEWSGLQDSLLLAVIRTATFSCVTMTLSTRKCNSWDRTHQSQA